ncbi:Heterokaryon incompatibility protein [Paramyrothecium foliicola]|nr:Heterokaryon incompatibility protein [Paramyrothecium foliicola]
MSGLYKDIDSLAREIRVVQVEAGSGNAKIKCKLVTVSLESKPQFEALSYVWGSSTQGYVVDVEGCLMNVTDNLHSALMRLRQPSEARVLWIDQLCINQCDVVERSQQVAIMGDIYKQSSQTLIWLGDETEAWSGASSDQSSILKTRPCIWKKKQGLTRDFKYDAWAEPCFTAGNWGDMCASYDQDYIHHAFKLISRLAETLGLQGIPYLKKGDDPLSLNTLRALAYIMHKPWWSRIWTLQECLIPSCAVIVYGTVEAPCQMFFLAAERYAGLASEIDPEFIEGLGQFRADTLRHFSQTLMDLSTYHTKQHYQCIDFRSLLRHFRSRQATNHKDKIYGLLGLNIDWRGRSPLLPDYTLETTQIYQSATLRSIQDYESLVVLITDMTRRQSGEDLELPSWVPDWSWSPSYMELLQRYEQTKTYSAASNTSTHARLDGLSRLVLSGTEVDTIGSTSDVMAPDTANSSPSTFLQWWTFSRNARAYNNPSETKPLYTLPQSPLDDAFWRTLCGNTVTVQTAKNGKYFAPDYKRATDIDFQRYMAWCQEHEPGLSSSDQNAAFSPVELHDAAEYTTRSIHSAICAATTMRRMFITRRGYLGLGPANTLEGDRIFLLHGGRTPFLLRKGTENLNATVHRSEDSYHFVGDCYVHGIMDGEAMAWDLPQSEVYLE